MEISTRLQSDYAERIKNDYQLVERARDKGDERAYADLMRKYREPIYMALLKMLKDPDAADDITMETFCKAFSSLEKYAPTRPFSSWLFTIATNGGIDYIRRQRHNTVTFSAITSRLSNDDDDTSVAELYVKDDSDPEAEELREYRYRVLRDLVQQMKPMYRQVVELRYFEELSYDEIAKRLNMPVGTVKSKLHRAHALLYKVINARNDFF